MEFFVDTADLAQIEESYSWGLVDGVTTNPSLIKKAVAQLTAKGSKIGIADYIVRILEVADGDPVSLEVIGHTEEDMFRQGMLLYETFNSVAENVVVKIPVNPAMDDTAVAFDGLKVIKRLADQGIPVNTTLIFTPEQALLAAKAGAAYVSPFAGRIDDELRKMAGGPVDKTGYYPEDGDESHHDHGIVSGVDLVAKCVEIMEIHELDHCRVLAASLRNPRQVRECALVGSHVATIPFEVLRLMGSHPKTVEGMRAFTADIVPEYARLFE
ncbi:MAG: transaldolase [Planctomycetes bacterium]|nr:transaldolase [Planctomycetota bacterium]